MIDRRRITRLFASALAPALIGAPAFAQAPSPSAWPNRFVRLVVPFPAGGGTDAVARILANRLSEVWGQQMVIENKGGAGSNIGADAVARSEPDGYTVLIGSLPLAVNRYLYSSRTYDALTDFAPVTLICLYPNLMVVPNSSPAKSVPEFIAHAKASGKITFASSGTGTSTHLSGELFKRMTGIEMTHVPYRGVALALNDVIPGRVDVMFNTMAGVLQQARSGQLRGLAVTTPKRFPTAPGIPDRGRLRARLRRLVVVRVPRAGQDTGRDRQEAACRHDCDPRGARDQEQAGASRRHGHRLDARGARRAAQVGNRDVGPGDQGCRDQARGVNPCFTAANSSGLPRHLRWSRRS